MKITAIPAGISHAFLNVISPSQAAGFSMDSTSIFEVLILNVDTRKADYPGIKVGFSTNVSPVISPTLMLSNLDSANVLTTLSRLAFGPATALSRLLEKTTFIAGIA